MKKYKLKIDLPFLAIGREFFFGDDTADVWGVEGDGEPMIYPLRTGLSGYLWLLKSEGDKYLEEEKQE